MAKGDQSNVRWKMVFCEAIHKRSLLEFEYRGFHRVVQPYCHGVSRTGVEVLRAIQIGGGSASRGYGFGKLWSIEDIVNPRVTGKTFTPNDPMYPPEDSGMREIHCRIERGQ